MKITEDSDGTESQSMRQQSSTDGFLDESNDTAELESSSQSR